MSRTAGEGMAQAGQPQAGQPQAGQPQAGRPALVVVTGLSGAGKSTALHALSDAGYYCVDNLPPMLAAATVRACRDNGLQNMALGMDVRVGSFLNTAREALAALRQEPGGLAVMFLDAADDVLVRRFSETRRPHPLLKDAQERADLSGVVDAVQGERERLAQLRTAATAVIDTSQMSVHDLRSEVLERFGSHTKGTSPMRTRVLSFGFKYGLPLDADLVLDVRFLDNPYFEPQLRELTGEHIDVRNFVLASPGANELLDRFEQLLSFALPRYETEGKSYLTVAIGCTGGRHRSVAIAVQLAKRLSTIAGEPIGIVHRDVSRDGMMSMVRATRDGRDSGKGESARAQVSDEGERI